MSTYIRKTKNPKSEKYEDALWMDDYFGKHHYGVIFPDGSVLDPDNRKQWPEIETSAEPTVMVLEDFSTVSAENSDKRTMKERWQERFDELATYNEKYETMLGCCGGDYCTGDHNQRIKAFISSELSSLARAILERKKAHHVRIEDIEAVCGELGVDI